LQEQRLLLSRQSEVEAAAAEELVGRRDRHHLEHASFAGSLQTGFHDPPTNPMSARALGNRQAADLSQFARIDFEGSKSDDLSVMDRQEAVRDEIVQFIERARKETARLDKRVEKVLQRGNINRDRLANFDRALGIGDV